MGSSVYFLALLTLFITFVQVQGASRQDVINQCHTASATNGSDTVCIGYNSQDADSRNDCSPAPETCFFAFAAISKAEGGYMVRLVGRGSGWVGLAFSDDEGQVMRADNLGVVCVNRLQPPVRILRIQERASSGSQPGPKLPFAFDDTGLSQSVRDPSFMVSDGWMVCEFFLSSQPRHSTRTLDLGGQMYKLALAGHDQAGVDDRTAESANHPVYHSRKGSSRTKVDVFQRVNGVEGVKAASMTVTMAASLVLMALVSKLLV